MGLFIALATAPPVAALVIVPALVLIPIVKILAVLLGAFGAPILGIGALLAHIKKWPRTKTLIVVITLIGALLLLGAIILKIMDPARPWL